MEENCENCKYGHISLQPQKSDEKTKLRTDGVYIQFGLKPWKTTYNTTNKCFYNILRVIDNEHIVVLGDSCEVFWERKKLTKYICFRTYKAKENCKYCLDDDKDNHPYNHVCNESCNIICSHEEENCECMKEINALECFRTNGYKIKPHYKKTVYDYYKITEPSNPIQTAKEISQLSLKELDIQIGIQTFSVCKLTTPITNSNKCPCTKVDNKVLGHVQFKCNDDFYLYYKDNPLILYDNGSPGRVLENHDNTCINTSPPMYFIPNDLSEKDTWFNTYNDWIKHRDLEVDSNSD